MKHPLRSISVLVLITCGLLLSACSPADDTVIPTLAQLPTITPAVAPQTGLATNPPSAAEGTATEVPIVLPPTIEVTPLASVDSNPDLENFPDTLTVGSPITLQGTFSATDLNNGVAVLTNSKKQTIILQVDPFTAQVAQNQVVQIIGDVVQQPGDPTKVVHVTDIRIVSGAVAIPTDAPVESLPTPTPEGL